MIISSQKYTDQEIVEQKKQEKDYIVSIATVGEYSVVVDGHHSLAAAKQDGVSPIFEECDPQIQGEIDYIVEENGVDECLEQMYNDCDYYDVETGEDVW